MAKRLVRLLAAFSGRALNSINLGAGFAIMLHFPGKLAHPRGLIARKPACAGRIKRY
jgi:hypothetical protein